ncbi:MAG: hypothetical protein H6779_01040 [Candidatus Nomurabacteria bacterium]|nr:hypothetical protein [Candidatus Nomurabacteria bacterium]USN88015.1 MAG: hypothetical protein H6779_01040 [Candidatus Nomurabacteria bacterium]
MTISGPSKSTLIRLMDFAANQAQTEAPHHKLAPNIMLHRPFETTDDTNLVVDSLNKSLRNARKTHVTVGELRYHNSKYLVLPIHSPLELANLWVNVCKQISLLSGYKPLPYDRERILDITIASGILNIGDGARHRIISQKYTLGRIELSDVKLLRKPVNEPSSNWEEVQTFSLPD